MPVKRTHLGEAELEIMQILWSAREPRTASQILAQLQGRRTWALSTLMTALARLGEKGFVHCDRSTRTNLYTAKVPARDYQAQEGKSLLQHLVQRPHRGPHTVLQALKVEGSVVGKRILHKLGKIDASQKTASSCR